MIRISLQFPWGLAGCGPKIPAGETELLLPEGTSVRFLLDSQGIPLKSVGLISANGSTTKTDYILKGRDKIQIYPPLEGG
ncbi:MAG: hypothetical protein LLG97_05500 [Deltaproteobacteria bacterium]|nr:hypothetical protein [Deltaproteobacteria bacterium]